MVSMYQLVRLGWHGPFTIDEIYTSDQEVFENIEGFYSFVCRSQVLYIGQVYFKSIRKRIEAFTRRLALEMDQEKLRFKEHLNQGSKH